MIKFKNIERACKESSGFSFFEETSLSFLKLHFKNLCACAQMCVKWEVLGVGSPFTLTALGIKLRSSGPPSKCLCPLSHLASGPAVAETEFYFAPLKCLVTDMCPQMQGSFWPVILNTGDPAPCTTPLRHPQAAVQIGSFTFSPLYLLSTF